MTGAGGTSWLLALCLSRVGVCTVFLVYAATLPVLQREWAMSATAAGSIASLFQLAYALSLMACSEIADRVGARRVFALGTVACAVAAVLFAAFARDYWSGLTLSTLLALTLGGTYTTGMLLIAEHVPVARRARAMGGYLAGYSLGLALGLVVSGVALTRGGYQLAFWLVAAGPVLGGLAVWPVLRGTPDTVRPRDEGGAARAVLRNRPAMLVVAGYAFHSWELLGMWAWTPAFLAACFVSAGSAPTEGAGRGAYVVALFHLTGTVASLLAGALADRVGRTPVLAVMAGLSAACSFVFGWLHGAPVAL
ncbi:MAG TPA: MFS transporter, partial [Candidatus Tectomicrobia bacterium]|nr:MFS transporter [Candidatus Tectomicrobia bacterium]